MPKIEKWVIHHDIMSYREEKDRAYGFTGTRDEAILRAVADIEGLVTKHPKDTDEFSLWGVRVYPEDEWYKGTEDGAHFTFYPGGDVDWIEDLRWTEGEIPRFDDWMRFFRLRGSPQRSRSAKSRRSLEPVFGNSGFNESVMAEYCMAYDCDLDTIYINDGYLFTVYDRHSPRWAVIKATMCGASRWNLDVWISHTRPVRRPSHAVLTRNEPDYEWRNCEPKNFLPDILVVVYTSPGNRGGF